MFQTRDIKNPETSETLVVTENFLKWQSDDRDTCMDKEDKSDQEENCLPSETVTPAEITDTEAVETNFNELTNKTEDSGQEETLDESRKGVPIEPSIEEAVSEESRGKSEEMKQSEEKKPTIPGSWRKGDVPSSTLTVLKFSQTVKNKVSAQKYPCFVPKYSRKVIILRYI